MKALYLALIVIALLLLGTNVAQAQQHKQNLTKLSY